MRIVLKAAVSSARSSTPVLPLTIMSYRWVRVYPPLTAAARLLSTLRAARSNIKVVFPFIIATILANRRFSPIRGQQREELDGAAQIL